MRKKSYEVFMGDFETTVYEGQQYTEVWASAVVKIGTEDVKIFHSINETFDYLVSLNTNIRIYYHNLKFDGTFWLYYLICIKHFEQAYIKIGEADYEIEWLDDNYMKNNTFKYTISDLGQWYQITLKINNKYIQIRDSLKLLPFSVKRIGEGFKTKHRKLEMEYTGFRYAGCNITEEEKQYIANDVLVVKEALEFMFANGNDKLTIGACCMKEFKSLYRKDAFEKLFPNVYLIDLDKRHGDITVGNWIHRSYRGGWCYVVKGKEKQVFSKGITLDVNSLYPSMMHSESKNIYPVGLPTFWLGDNIPDEARDGKHYYFIRVKCRFTIKPNKLPFIQIKGDWRYKATEMLETSDIYNPKTGNYNQYYRDIHGNIRESKVLLTMTMTDYKLFLEHYDVYDLEIIDGCYFKAYAGIFDDYISKWKKLKIESKGAMRELAKLFLNNLYGKMAASTDSSFKFAYEKQLGIVSYQPVEEHAKTPGYIPIGSAITSYARNFTIRAAQQNYYGKDKPGFIYADTDSIHCDLDISQIKGVKIDDVNFCCWKPEATWDSAIFVRQKTYIEHVVEENLHPIDTPYYNIKCAGLPDKCKALFNTSLTGKIEEGREYTEDEIKFLYDKEGNLIRRTYKDFDIGLEIPGKLLPKRILGGTLLVESMYVMRGSKDKALSKEEYGGEI